MKSAAKTGATLGIIGDLVTPGIDEATQDKVYSKMECIVELVASRYAIRMTENHPAYILAAIVAIMTAVLLRLVGMPAPWPPAIAIYVYGALSWPVLRHRMPAIRPTTYAMIWLGAALILMMYEGLAQAARLS